MNLNKLTLALVLLLALAGGWYLRHQADQNAAALAALAKDRDFLEDKVEKLSRLLMEQRESFSAQIAALAKPRTAPPVIAEAASKPTEPAPRPGVTTKAPAGWGKNGSKPNLYVVGVDQNESLNGVPSAYVRSLEGSVDGFGGMMQSVSAEEYLGKRVRLSGWMKTEEANEGGGHLWLRVDGQQVGASLQFDNMNNRAPKGTTGWQQYSVVLDVPNESRALAYGFFVQGGGTVWANSTKVEVVGNDVPSTNMNASRPSLPKAPVNPGFAP